MLDMVEIASPVILYHFNINIVKSNFHAKILIIFTSFIYSLKSTLVLHISKLNLSVVDLVVVDNFR